MTAKTNLQVVLARRPVGVPVVEDFGLRESAIPEAGAGEAVVRTEFVSVDPYMRGRLWEQPHRGDPVAIGQVMIGEGVGEVVASRRSGHAGGRDGAGLLWVAAVRGHLLSDELERIDRDCRAAVHRAGRAGYART